jgi:hypothetical protein
MSGVAVVDADPVEARLSRLARMPDDTDAAIARWRRQIDAARLVLGTTGEPLLRDALDDAVPIVPCLPRAATTAAVLDQLEMTLQQHHPEEIHVASYAFWCRLATRVRETSGTAAVQSLLDALESTPR